MKKTGLKLPALAFAFLLMSSTARSQPRTGITIPNFNDEYCKTIKILEGGVTDVDYTNFRHSFLASKQYEVKHKAPYDSLNQKLYDAVSRNETRKVISIAKAMLSIDYTSMTAHKYLRQASKITGDTAMANKHYAIQFGLMHSILKTGDANSCETAWEVTQLEEEYFLMRMRGATLKRQSIEQAGKNICDKLDVVLDDGQAKTYYFKTNRIFAKYPKIK